MNAAQGSATGQANPTELQQEISMVLRDTRSKGYRDLRDRAAYMYVTGTYPSHLRVFFTRALGFISTFAQKPSSLDGRGGNIAVNAEIVATMGLDEHPMVTKVRDYIEQGYRIIVSRGSSTRKPYTKIFLQKGQDEITVQIDGSVLDHWPEA